MRMERTLLDMLSVECVVSAIRKMESFLLFCIVRRILQIIRCTGTLTSKSCGGCYM